MKDLLATRYAGAYFDAFVESMPDVVWVKDIDGRFLTCNAVVERFFGAPREKIVGKTDHDFVEATLANQFRESDLAAMATDTPLVSRDWLTFPGDSTPRLLETKKTPMLDSDGNVLGILGVARDITEHHVATSAQQSLNRALKLIGRCNHAMMHTHDERTLLFDICQLAVDTGGYRLAWVGFAECNEERSVSIAAWSRGSETFVRQIRVTWGQGELASGIIGNAIRHGVTVVNRDYRANPSMRPWRELAEAHGLRSSIAIPLMQNDAVFGTLMIGCARPDAFGAEEQELLEEMAADLSFGVQTLRARSERDAAKRQLEFLAHHDALTGTPNRLMLREQFAQAVHQASHSGTSVAVLLLDLDNFKFVNDSLGHDYGDRLLIEVTHKLKRRVRDAGSVYRYGGDEFVVLLHPVCELSLLESYVRKLIDAFTSPITVDDYAIDTTVSAGLSLFPTHSTNLDDLLHFADTALQKSKQTGKNTFHLFNDSMRSDEQELVRLRSQLRSALRNKEFVLYFQPKIDLTSGCVAGAEALVRWEHPERGLLGPATFIPLAERTGLIVPIGDWVIEEACRNLASWLERGLPLQSVSVNVSALQVRRGNLLLSVTTALRRWHVPAKCLELELTESVFLDDIDTAVSLIDDLRRLGVKLSIDDFGTGYSSLAYLRNLPVHRLKVDQSFVRDMANDPNALAIVKTIVQLGLNLNLVVTAEGVEDQSELEMLRELGCSEVQGYLISRPVNAATLEAFCQSHTPTP